MLLRDFWRQKGPGNRLLLPVSYAFALCAGARRLAYRQGFLRRRSMPVPVVVVGGITAGGGGKTPFVIALARQLAGKGLHPGVVMRGYRGSSRGPLLVEPDSSLAKVGDEALLVRREAGVPVCIARSRPDAAVLLLGKQPQVDILISDDGLQHYALRRDLEIAVVDPGYGLGNGWMLPAGPLREPAARLRTADIIVGADGANGSISIVEAKLVPLGGGESADPKNLKGTVAAVAGIANPWRFFNTLEREGIALASKHPFPDHHDYRRDDLRRIRADCIVMTPKDAVKCRQFADDRCLAWTVTHAVDSETVERVCQLIHGPQAA